jgi:thymidylate synthase
MKKYSSINEALVKLSQDILNEGVWRETRGFRCLEFPHPVTICITNPTDRYVTIKSRKWNKVLPFAELAWLLSGLNDLDALPGHFVKNLYNFSDDGRTWRAGYGPRIRFMSGFRDDYDISKREEGHVISGHPAVTDQLRYVVQALRKDRHSRQAIIEIADPVKDNFGNDGFLKRTKDQPCTRLLNFQERNGALDLTVYMRSNDLLWGFSAVNVFNFTFMLEIVAAMVDIPVGNYYHVTNNLHVYEDKLGLVREIAEEEIPEPMTYHYFHPEGISLLQLDKSLDALIAYENKLWRGDINAEIPEILLENNLFSDWVAVFQNHYKVPPSPTQFINPIINRLWQI